MDCGEGTVACSFHHHLQSQGLVQRKEVGLNMGQEVGKNLRKVRIKAEREERDSNEQGRRKEGQRGMCTSVPFPFLNPVWVYLAAKPIHHAEDRCLRLKVTVNGKTSECQGPVNLLPPSLILGLA